MHPGNTVRVLLFCFEILHVYMTSDRRKQDHLVKWLVTQTLNEDTGQ